jgi:hypothetical protein
LPDEDAEGAGSATEVRDRLDTVVDRAAERLAGLPVDRLGFAGRWSGFVVTIGFRLGRWSSHMREHTVQVEKTLAMLDRKPTEVDRLVRLTLAAWGRAEQAVYGSPDPTAGEVVLERAATSARATAAEIAALA